MPLAIIYPVVMHTLLARSPAASSAPLLVTEGRQAKGPAAALEAAAASPLSRPELLANVLIGILGVGICIFASAFAIITWPR